MIKEALLYEKIDGLKVKCLLCAHQCKIEPSKVGVCKVRKNIDGRLHSLVYAQTIASNVDPIEKNPLYHFFPGTKAFSIATPGCNFQCGFCQNWQISQAPRIDIALKTRKLLPEEVVKKAKEYNCKSISYTYTEPTIFFEYAYETAKIAKEEGLYNNFVTNGYMSQKALKMIHPYLDGANVDLKSFRDDFYKKICKARLQPVLDSIALMKKLNIWVEVTTLIIPGQNDSQEELGDIAEFISSVGIDIPWHISRFHPDYQFTDYNDTSLEVLQRAGEIGKKAGLHYVYLGNVLDEPNTSCYNCQKPLIKRAYFSIEENKIEQGKCSFCKATIAGVFD
jgi:pyruvate formate lyase activating enzyme